MADSSWPSPTPIPQNTAPEPTDIARPTNPVGEPAHVGDLVVIGYRVHAVASRPSRATTTTRATSIRVLVGIVLSTTPAGRVTEVDTGHLPGPVTPRDAESLHVAPRELLDVDAAMAEVLQLRHKGWRVQPFDSVEQAKTLLRPFLRHPSAGRPNPYPTTTGGRP